MKSSTLFLQKFANCIKKAEIYVEEKLESPLFCVDYDVTYNNGEILSKCAWTPLQDALTALNLSDKADLIEYFEQQYGSNPNAWNLVVQELRNAGVHVQVDEDEGEVFADGNFALASM